MGNAFSALRHVTQVENDAPNADTAIITGAKTTAIPGPSSTLPPSTNPKYDVFISHAGDDKGTIALPLRKKLRERGITAFVDQADLQPGNDGPKAMTDAMETASVAVVVLSPEYLSRRWPMRELMHFLIRRRECSAANPSVPVIIPFFYRLKISELCDEPRLDRKDGYGNLLYRTEESKFYERQKRGEPEANVEAIKSALMALRSITGVTNFLEASNDPSYLMSRRRGLLIQHLTEAVGDAMPTEAVNLRVANSGRKLLPDDKHILGERSDELVDRFRRSFPPLSTVVRAVLDFDSTDEGDPTAPEGLVKQHLLQNTRNHPKMVSIHGIGGVGKSTILRALSVDDDIQNRFPDGVHVLKLGKDASSATLLRRLCRVLKDSGAEKTCQSLSIQNDIEAVLDFVETWFHGKKCAFLIDDVWMHGIGLSLISRLCNIGSANGSSLLITTREHEIATLAPRETIVRLEPREARESVAQQILFLHADRQEMDHSTSLPDSIYRILDICAGLPVNLAAAGKSVKKMSISMRSGRHHMWKQYLSELEICRGRLLRENVESYGNVFATFATSIAILDKKPREETLGFACALSFSEMYMRLCVLRKQSAVPSSMLKHLWQTESDEHANVIARTFVESGLATREAIQKGEEYIWYLSLHDSLHDFAVAEANRTGSTKNAHECLLDGYKSEPETRREASGARRCWSQNVESDGYLYRNLCRHLRAAGRSAELVRLLMTPQWTEAQFTENGILFVEADFTLGVEAVRDAMPDATSQERAEMETVLRLIWKAVNHSSPFALRSIGELWYQVLGRLKRYAESYVAIREYMSRIEKEGAKPLIVCKSGFPGEVGGAHMRSISVGIGIGCMAMMNDGERVACGCRDGRIFVVNTKRNHVERQWKAHDHMVVAIAVGRDDTRLVSGSYDTTAKVWEVETGRCVSIFDEHSHRVRGVAVMRDGRRAISCSWDGTTRMWDMGTGQALSNPCPSQNDSALICVALLGHREDMVVTGGNDHKLKVWNMKTETQIEDTFDGHSGSVRCVAVTPDRRSVVSGSHDRSVRVWDLRSHQQIGGALEGHTNDVACLSVSGDGRRLVTGSLDFTIRVWDLESRTEICDPLEGHISAVSGVSFSEGDDRIVSCSWDGSIRVWDVTGNKTETLTNRHESAVSCVSFTPDGNFVVSGSWDKTLRIWDAKSGHQVGTALEGHLSAINDVAVTADGRGVLSVSDDGTLRVWDLESCKLLHTLTGHAAWIWCVAITPQGDLAVTGSDDQTIRVWNLAAMDCSPVVLDGGSASVERIFVSNDGLRIISVDRYDNIFVWKLETRQVVKQLTQKDAWRLSRREVLGVVGERTAHDDTTLSIPLRGREIVLGEGLDGTVLATMEADVYSWALCPDKKTICVGLYDGQVVFMKLLK